MTALSADTDAWEVVVVHDYLNQRGGAERVVLELASVWPDAPLYTSLYRPQSTFPEFQRFDVRSSPLNHIPVDKGFRQLFPLYPLAFRALGPLSADVVISSSSGWAHAIRTAPHTLHAVYCHTPARWLYGASHLRENGRRRRLLRLAIGRYRRWDRTAAGRADVYIANSNGVRDRIKRVYGIDAEVVHPPVNVERFAPTPRGDRLLVVSRLLPYKRIDVAVDAATKAGIGLDVVGTGPSFKELRERAGPTVEFHGRLSDSDVTALIEHCRAFCLPGKEDFGIGAIEANAAGKPVVALGQGGALETMRESVTASFFYEPSADGLLAALRRCDRIDASPELIAENAWRFSRSAFRERIMAVLRNGLEAKRAAAAH